jgi:[acyl-carrier-protein] S-malonyltransferase
LNTSANVAVVFPGQGSQSTGMLAVEYKQFRQVKTVFEHASDVLHYDVWALVSEPELQQRLNQTEFTQAVMLTADLAMWQILTQELGVAAEAIVALAGHSLGEYAALVAAGQLEFAKALQLVSARGRYMQAAVAGLDTAMLAVIGLPLSRVEELCSQLQQVFVANINSPEQIVLGGLRASIMQASLLFKEAQAKRCVLLEVSVPAHTPLMQTAAEQLYELLQPVTWAPACTAVWHNLDAARHKPAELPQLLSRHVCSPVHWLQTIEQLANAGVSQIIECGPGQVLTGLNRRIVSKHLSIHVTELYPQLIKAMG